MPPPAANTPTQRRALPPSSTLLEIHNTLHLLYHRNKNQHRCAKWFKSLAMLRRATRKLAWELERVEEACDDVDYDDGDGDGNHSMARKMMAHLGAEVIPRSYRAFSTVVADTQFSALGVVLIALLSRLSKVIGATEYFPADERTREEAETRGATTAAATDRAGGISLNTEDLGEVVARHGRDASSGGIEKDGVAGAARGLGKGKNKKRAVEGNESARTSERLATGAEQSGGREERRGEMDKRKKKKRRKGNAIDDIFEDI